MGLIMAKYQHPIMPRDGKLSARAGIFKPNEHDPDKAFPLKQGTLDVGKVTTDLDEYFRELHASEEMRIKLGIPRMAYHAYSFRLDYDCNRVRRLIIHARSTGLELRVWHNDESGNLVVCLADPDTSEDSGWELYGIMEAVGYDGYGLASWYEFIAYGVPIADNWRLFERSGKLFAESPDKQQVVFF